jgi:hypothetical protein
VAFTTHPQLSAEVKERVELYLFSPSGPSWPIIGWPCLLTAVLEHFTSVTPCCPILNFHRRPVNFKKRILDDGMRRKYINFYLKKLKYSSVFINSAIYKLLKR